jgi:hypothetical protein
MKYTVDILACPTLSLIKIGSTIQKLIGVGSQTHRRDGDCICLF